MTIAAPTRFTVALDFSAASKSLLDDTLSGALALATKLGAAVDLVAVLPPRGLMGFETLSHETHETMAGLRDAEMRIAHRELDRLLDLVRAAGLEGTRRLMIGPEGVPQQIVKAATEAGADAIVLSTHSRRGIRYVLLGSVAERVAHLAPMSVYLLRPRPVDDDADD